MHDGRIVFDSFQLAVAQTTSTFAVGGFVDIAENELALPAGVCGTDDSSDTRRV